MPSINLRLTDEEHAALEAWARGSHRSLQREIIFRLFSHDLPNHVKEAVTRVERDLTEDLRAATGRDDLVAEVDLTPVDTKPRRRAHPCRHHVPPSRVCKYCDV